MNQCEMILEYMRRYGSITPLEALNELGCMRLGARIWDLRHAGNVIVSEREDGLNRNGNRVSWSRYYLRGDV